MAHGDYGAMPTMPPMKFKKAKGAVGEAGTLAKPSGKKVLRGSRRAAGQKGRRKG